MIIRCAAIIGLMGVAACSTPQPEIRPLATTQLERLGPFEQEYKKGKAEFVEGRYGLAIVEFERALAMEPKSVATLNGLGAAYDNLHRYDVAQQFYRRALEIQPNSVATINNMAVSYQLAGDREALTWFARAAKLDLHNTQIAANFAQARRADSQVARGEIPLHGEIDNAEQGRPVITRLSESEYDLYVPISSRLKDLGRAINFGATETIFEVNGGIGTLSVTLYGSPNGRLVSVVNEATVPTRQIEPTKFGACDVARVDCSTSPQWNR